MKNRLFVIVALAAPLLLSTSLGNVAYAAANYKKHPADFSTVAMIECKKETKAKMKGQTKTTYLFYYKEDGTKITGSGDGWADGRWTIETNDSYSKGSKAKDTVNCESAVNGVLQDAGVTADFSGDTCKGATQCTVLRASTATAVDKISILENTTTSCICQPKNPPLIIIEKPTSQTKNAVIRRTVSSGWRILIIMGGGNFN